MDKHRYIINAGSLKAYKLNDIEFKPNTLYTTFKQDELKKLPEHAYKVIAQDIRPQDVFRVETLPHGRQRAYYEVIDL